jgi:hypothetical protein
MYITILLGAYQFMKLGTGDTSSSVLVGDAKFTCSVNLFNPPDNNDNTEDNTLNKLYYGAYCRAYQKGTWKYRLPPQPPHIGPYKPIPGTYCGCTESAGKPGYRSECIPEDKVPKGDDFRGPLWYTKPQSHQGANQSYMPYDEWIEGRSICMSLFGEAFEIAGADPLYIAVDSFSKACDWSLERSADKLIKPDRNNTNTLNATYEPLQIGQSAPSACSPSVPTLVILALLSIGSFFIAGALHCELHHICSSFFQVCQ